MTSAVRANPFVQNFLRPPATALDIAADGVRLLGVISVVIAAVWFTLLDAGVVAFSLPALMLPRFLALRPGWDIAVALSVLVAAWSNIFGLYESIPGWDLVVHAVVSGAITLMGLQALAHVGVLPGPARSRHPRVSGAVLGGMLALAFGALWEMVEWAGRTFVTAEIIVSYNDTIGDLAADGVGGVVAGLVLAGGRVTRPDSALRPPARAEHRSPRR
ncbi:hypothetical protein QSU92_09650 [Microbacterium sp. ET2]|uniref:hypothetical protein n=1 Tax=Microbacterium albipurpureum TaxID=3050384 RepID=UPI00259D1011|nr:hypothetical protein [Microbacterium sp. ET2 (Ac-2212)]WJL94262.1 hypothetical protein QSU92_09650 [Microbacterium sp. ET2 (Ac-2212)]